MLFGPVAQLARASALHAEGQGFESPRVHHNEFSTLVSLMPTARSARLESAVKGFFKSISNLPFKIVRFEPTVFKKFLISGKFFVLARLSALLASIIQSFRSSSR